VGMSAPGQRARIGKHDWTHAFHQGVALLLLALVSGTGCTFWGLSGGGPVTKARAFEIIGRPPLRLSEEERELCDRIFRETDWKAQRETAVGRRGHKVTIKSKDVGCQWALWGLGYLTERKATLVNTGTEVKRLYKHSDTFVPLFPLAWVWCQERRTYYSLETGEEIMNVRFYGVGALGVLAGFVHDTEIAGLPTGPLSCSTEEDVCRALALRETPESAYIVRWGGCLGAGLIAFGRVNERFHAQLAWIPIPLWKARR